MITEIARGVNGTCSSLMNWHNVGMQIEIITQLNEVPAVAWNALVQDNNPFVRHEFLSALETHGCVGKKFGWLPCHILVYDAGELIGAMPLYEKYNSYGEFVFDHAWAEAYKRYGLRYFPKLVSSVPYSPVSGQRLLAKTGVEKAVFPRLVQAACELAKTKQASGVHWLFANEQDWLETQYLVTRHDCQYHWRNFNYQHFDAFLETLQPKKRKNIKQERRKVNDAGVRIRCLNGYTASEQDWARFAFFYQHTFESKWGIPTLNEGFFKAVAKALPEQVLLVMADKDNECIAGSLMYISNTRLYGRHWGCVEYIDSLHFEACYYQGIEYCIEHQLTLFEPGAQGEHKVARGFIPTLTRSSHYLVEAGFRPAIKQHAQFEQRAVADYMQGLKAHLPYRQGFLDECER